ncbi:MAG: hypothetical protein VX460_01030 [Planctomycetota bacterium]|nr:hypothetical protein [Planctomycetota bacterium]
MLRALLIVLVGVLVAAAPALAQSERTAAGRRAAWEKLDPEERAALRERYERLRAMSPEERERALTLSRRMRLEAEATLRSLDPSERAEVEALEPAERSRVLRSLIVDRARMMATRLQAHLTDEERARIEGGDAIERSVVLERVRARMLEQLPGKARRMAEAQRLSPREIERLSSADPQELRVAMISLARRRAAQVTAKQGLPEGLTQAEWDRVLALPDSQFVRALQRLRASHPGFGVPARRVERARRRQGELASQLMSLGTPSTRDRLNAPNAGERALVRRAVLRSRAKIEGLVERRMQLRADLMLAVRELDDDSFVSLHRRLLRVLVWEKDPRRSIERWLDGRAGGAEARDRDGRGRRRDR